MRRAAFLLALAAAASCAACDAIDAPDARAIRAYEAALKQRDPDKRQNIYSCITRAMAGSERFSNYRAIFGDAMRIETVHPDGSETWVVEQWAALPGPDRVVRRGHIDFKAGWEGFKVGHRIDVVDPEWRDDC